MANGVDKKLSKLEREAMRGDNIQEALLQLFNEYSMRDAATRKRCLTAPRLTLHRPHPPRARPPAPPPRTADTPELLTFVPAGGRCRPCRRRSHKC